MSVERRKKVYTLSLFFSHDSFYPCLSHVHAFLMLLAIVVMSISAHVCVLCIYLTLSAWYSLGCGIYIFLSTDVFSFLMPLSICFSHWQIKEMTKELDMLLQSIEETGGFRDACTVFQRQKVEELEEGIGSLSEKCGMWRVTIHSYIYFIHVYACEYMDI